MRWGVVRGWIIGCTFVLWGVSLLLVASTTPLDSEEHESKPLRDRSSQPQCDPAVHLVAHDEEVNAPATSGRFTELPPLTPAEQQTLATLPPACLSGLPGLSPASPDSSLQIVSTSDQPSLPGELPLPVVAPSHSGLFNPHAKATADARLLAVENRYPPVNPACDPHAEVFSASDFPSALECRKCHSRIYDEWAVSSHANAALSPMFQKFEQKLEELAQGTLGYFCYRCHAPVATTLSWPREQPIYDGPRVLREGITCVVCHRVAESYVKVNGERRIEPGPVTAPVFGTGNGDQLESMLKRAEFYKLKTDANLKTPGQPVHRRVIQFEEISHSTFCTSCHQVAVHPGIKLEVVWEQYRNSPAYKKGIRCHDCHMGKVPGLPEGFEVDYAAIVNDKPVGAERRHSNHLFYGPGASIAHPGLFPHHPDADRFPPRAWLSFNWRARWGSEEFEQRSERGETDDCFPPEWAEPDDRRDAWEILTANFKRLQCKDDTRLAVMENGSHIAGPWFEACAPCGGKGPFPSGRELKISYAVTNTNSGHNMPTGSLGAQPQLWLNVSLVNPAGEIVWQSGYLDSQGDLADNHSIDVHKRRVPFDRQLVNYQTKFLITNVKGTDRELPLPVNIDIDQIPFLRPAPQPVSVMNHPPFIRMEAHSIAPLGTRVESYVIPGDALAMSGTYRLSIRMRSRGEPIYFMKFVEATPEMIRRMNEKILDIHRQTVTFEVQ